MENYMKNYNGILPEAQRKELLDRAVENVSGIIEKTDFLDDGDKVCLNNWLIDDFPTLDDFSLKIMGKPDTVQAYFDLVKETSEDKFMDIGAFVTCIDAAEFLNDTMEEYPLEWEIINAKIKSGHDREDNPPPASSAPEKDEI